MSTWRPNDDGYDSEEEETVFDIKGHEAYIFVVDAFIRKKAVPFLSGLKLVKDALLSGVLVNDRDLIGVVFANIRDTIPPLHMDGMKNVVVPANCSVCLPLRQLNKNIVEHYLHFMEREIKNFHIKYGMHQGKFPNMLRLCGNMFQQCGKTLANRTILYITDREMPHKVGDEEINKSFLKAIDMEAQNIDFNVIPMIDEFNYEPFYKEFLSLVKGMDISSFEIPDPQFVREMASNRKIRLNINKRCLGHVNWHIGGDVELSVKFYNYFQKPSYPQKVYLRRRDNSVVTAKIANYIDETDPDTGDVINRREASTDDEVYELSFGNESVQVDESEMQKICFPYEPTLKLMGFKLMTELTLVHYLRPCTFIYPDESRIAGSTKLFTALWMKCREKNKVPFCVFIPRKKAKPAFVALVPVSINEDKERTYMDGDGFKAVYVPLAEDLHHFDLKHFDILVHPEPEGIELFNAIVQRVRVKYDPALIREPALDELQAQLLKLAFNFKYDNSEDDKVPPTTGPIDERIAHYAEEIERIFGKELVVAEKRKTSKSAKAGSAAKVTKIADDNLTVSMVDSLIATDSLESLNKEQIATFLKQKKVHVNKTMTKAVLIEKLLKWRQPKPN